MKLEKFKQKSFSKIGIILFTVVCVLILAGVFFYTSFATFHTKAEFTIMHGTVQDLGDVYFAYYVDGELVSELPTQNSGYVFESSSCTHDATVEWDNSKWAPLVTNLTQTRTKCTLYFKKTKKVNTVLGELEVYDYIPDFTKSACDDEVCESHEKGIFETTDADGTSYYYRGSVENNYFKFANLWWRIIRINGDGTIRLIYDGTTAHDNGEISEDRQIGTSQFNLANNDNMYVGYMYTSEEIHGTTTSSTIKTAVDTFYEQKLVSYASYIDTNAGFCGDRSPLVSPVSVTASTYYDGYLRVLMSTPTLICKNNADLYTVSSSNQGNKALQYPIGLITVDEVIFSGNGGGVFDGNYNYTKSIIDSYLITGYLFITITHAGYYIPLGSGVTSTLPGATLFVVNPIYETGTTNGIIGDQGVERKFRIRPVINLKSNVKIIGDGTKENPYKIQ